ncbi:MAG: DUF1684 domain-containing protein [Candidatus Kapaibacteriota bacterium]
MEEFLMIGLKDIIGFTKAHLYIVLVFVFFSCTLEEDNTLMYDESTIIERRKELDAFFKQDPASPLKEQQKEQFTSLQYFAPNEEFAFYAEFSLNKNPDTVQLLTTKGSEKRTMLRYGTFTVQDQNGSAFTLTGFKSLEQEDDVIFIPFKDKTNGFDTYEAGRYLEVDEISTSGEYLLDFNRAYNPYCAYNKDYVCPLVPKENILSISIKAGEKRPIF